MPAPAGTSVGNNTPVGPQPHPEFYPQPAPDSDAPVQTPALVSGFPQDIEYQPEEEFNILNMFSIGESRGVDIRLPVLEGDTLPEMMESKVQDAANFLQFVTGYNDTEEQINPILALNNLFNLAKGEGLFDGIDLQTRPETPYPETALVFPESGFGVNQSFGSVDGLLETNMTPAGSQLLSDSPWSTNALFERISDDVSGSNSKAITDDEPPRLTRNQMLWLSNNIENWDEDNNSEHGVRDFIVGEMGNKLGLTLDSDAIDTMSDLEVINLYQNLLQEEYDQRTQANLARTEDPFLTGGFNILEYERLQEENEWLEEELALISELNSVMQPTPLEQTGLLYTAFGVDTEEDVRINLALGAEPALEYLRTAGVEIPAGNPDEMEVLAAANYTYDVVNLAIDTAIAANAADDPGYSDSEYEADQFYRNFPVGHGPPDEYITKLEGTYTPPDFGLLVFAASVIFEPLDIALSAGDFVNALSEGDVTGAIAIAGMTLGPMSPRFGKMFFKMDPDPLDNFDNLDDIPGSGGSSRKLDDTDRSIFATKHGPVPHSIPITRDQYVIDLSWHENYSLDSKGYKAHTLERHGSHLSDVNLLERLLGKEDIGMPQANPSTRFLPDVNVEHIVNSVYYANKNDFDRFINSGDIVVWEFEAHFGFQVGFGYESVNLTHKELRDIGNIANLSDEIDEIYPQGVQIRVQFDPAIPGGYQVISAFPVETFIYDGE